MYPSSTNIFKNIFVVDFEFKAGDSEKPEPVCVAWQEVFSGEIGSKWLYNVVNPQIPYTVGETDLLVGHASSAEWACHSVLNWPMPLYVVDTFAEFRNRTNHVANFVYSGLIDACAWYGIPTISQSDKKMNRDLILNNTVYSEEDKQKILAYCESDIVETTALFKSIIAEPKFNLPQALHRGNYTKPCAKIELAGVPLDVKLIQDFKEYWPQTTVRLIEKMDHLNFYVDGVLKQALYEKYVYDLDCDWPLTKGGNHYSFSKDTLKNMSLIFPEFEPYRILRNLLDIDFKNIMIGADGRSRTSVFPFWTKTGRNSPQDSLDKKADKRPRNRFIFGTSKSLRGLIKPPQGETLIYLDFKQQEYFLAAVLSGDENMRKIYFARDPYIMFAFLAGAVPEWATKDSHPKERKLYKKCMLAAQYGISVKGLAKATGLTESEAHELLKKHKTVFCKYWAWYEEQYKQACWNGRTCTCFGWNMDVYNSERLTICNFPVQGTGAEILRCVCIDLDLNGIQILAPVHDAVLIGCKDSEVGQTSLLAKTIMGNVSEEILGHGNRLLVDEEIITYPNRFLDDDADSIKTWNSILEALLEAKQT